MGESMPGKATKWAGKLISLGIIILVVLILAVIALLINVNATIKVGGETVVTKITGGQTTIGDVDVSLLEGNLLLRDIVIKNPSHTVKGEKTDFSTVDFFKLGTLKVHVDMSSLFSDVIHVKEVTVEAPFVSYEKTPLSDSNHHVLMEHVNASTKQDKEEKDEPEKDRSGKKIIIDHLLISDGTLNLSSCGITAPIPLPTFEINDMGKKESGIKIGTAIATFMGELFSNTVSATKQQGANLGRWGKDASKKLGDSSMDVFKKTGDSLKAAGRSLKEGGKQILKTMTP